MGEQGMPRVMAAGYRRLGLSAPNCHASQRGQRSDDSVCWGHFHPGKCLPQWPDSLLCCELDLSRLYTKLRRHPIFLSAFAFSTKSTVFPFHSRSLKWKDVSLCKTE